MASKGGFGFGIVGCGMIAEFHAQAVQAMKGGHLECVFSRSEKNAKRVGKQFGAAWYTDYGRFLKHPGLDVVTIATPSGAHAEPAVKALRAGKHVACEKPLEVTLERCDRMIEAARKAGVGLAGIFPSRFVPAFQEAHSAVERGRLGTPTMGIAYIPWHRTQEYYDSGGWRGTWKLDGGGAAMNQSSHTIDLLQWFMGPVVEIAAFADCLIHKRVEVEDIAVASLRFKSGALGAIIATTAAWPAHPRRVDLAGSDGSIFIRDNDIVTWEFSRKAPRDAAIRRKYGPRPDKGRGQGAADPRAISFVGHQRQFEDFVSALKSGGDPLVNGIEARKAVEIILGIYASALGRRVVRLPLAKTPRRRAFRKT